MSKHPLQEERQGKRKLDRAREPFRSLVDPDPMEETKGIGKNIAAREKNDNRFFERKA